MKIVINKSTASMLVRKLDFDSRDRPLPKSILIAANVIVAPEGNSPFPSAPTTIAKTITYHEIFQNSGHDDV